MCLNGVIVSCEDLPRLNSSLWPGADVDPAAVGLIRKEVAVKNQKPANDLKLILHESRFIDPHDTLRFDLNHTELNAPFKLDVTK